MNIFLSESISSCEKDLSSNSKSANDGVITAKDALLLFSSLNIASKLNFELFSNIKCALPVTKLK